MDICSEWQRNRQKHPVINPLTNRKIKLDGPTYRSLDRQCGISESEIEEIEPAWGRRSSHLSSRTRECDKVVKILRTLPTSQYGICMSGSRSGGFRQHMTNVRLLGHGSFGEIYIAKIGGALVVVKEAYLTPTEKKIITEDHLHSKNIGQIPPESYPEEYVIDILINDILDNRQCQNFIYTYDLGVCEDCKLQIAPLTKTVKFCYTTFMEPADFSLDKIDSSTLNEDDAYNFLYQLLLAVITIHQVYGIFHTDIKLENILVKTTSPGGFYEYKVGRNTYYVENRGYILCLADFGASRVFKPIVQTKINPKLIKGHASYGSRNAAVRLISGRPTWEPIICQYNIEINKTGKITKGPAKLRQTWITPNKETFQSTWNQFYKGVDINPNILVDLNDTVTFPPFEFGLDIADVFRTLIGGKRTSQSGDHVGIFHQPLPELREMFTQTPRVWGGPALHTTASVKNYRADIMLQSVYIPPPSRPKNIIDTFILSD